MKLHHLFEAGKIKLMIQNNGKRSIDTDLSQKYPDFDDLIYDLYDHGKPEAEKAVLEWVKKLHRRHGESIHYEIAHYDDHTDTEIMFTVEAKFMDMDADQAAETIPCELYLE